MIDESNIFKNLNFADEKSYEIFFKKFYPELYQYAFRIVRSGPAAEEIVQDLFLYIWENSGSDTINTSLRSYLFKSVFNRCLKYLRHIKVEQKYADSLHYTLRDAELYGTASQDYPLENIIVRELESEIIKAIANLPEQCREIFLLHRESDFTYLEIAQKLNISINTVKTQMGRALCKIKDSLKDYF